MSKFPLPVSGRLFVGGEWLAARDDFADRNPANLDEVVGTFPNATPEEVASAVEAARNAFPAWRRTSRILRAEAFAPASSRYLPVPPVCALLRVLRADAFATRPVPVPPRE